MTPKSDKYDNVFLPDTFEERKERAMKKALDVYWKDKQLGPTATMMRLAFYAGFRAGMEFEDAEKWRKMMEQINHG